MAITNGTVHSVRTVMSDAVSELQVVEILFTLSGTYAQADNSKLLGVAALIQASRRNGKTVTMRDVMTGTPATRADTNALMTIKTVAISSADVSFELCTTDYSTEFTDATAVPAQNRPFSILVAITEA